MLGAILQIPYITLCLTHVTSYLSVAVLIHQLLWLRCEKLRRFEFVFEEY